MSSCLTFFSDYPSRHHLSGGEDWEGTSLTLHYFVDDSIYLFVVNHPQHKSKVEIFRLVEENTLEHLKTIVHPLLHKYTPRDQPSPNTASFLLPRIWIFLFFLFFYSVNDVLAVGTDSFYATNDTLFPSEALNYLVSMLGLAWCDVVFYSPEEVRASGIMFANGINISPDRRFCWVSVCVPFHRNI